MPASYFSRFPAAGAIEDSLFKKSYLILKNDSVPQTSKSVQATVPTPRTYKETGQALADMFRSVACKRAVYISDGHKCVSLDDSSS